MYPLEFLNKKVTIDSVVQDYEFFSSKPVDQWTFEHYISGLNLRDLNQVQSLLRKYKQSLSSLRRMKSLDRNIKSYVGALKAKEYTDNELRSFLPKSKETTNNNVTINMRNSTIFSANDDSRVIINNLNKNKRNPKRTPEEEEVSTNDVSNTLDTGCSTDYVVKNINILPKWKHYKLDCQRSLLQGKSTVENDTAKLMSQAHIMLLKKNETDPDLVKLLGADVIDEVNNIIYERFSIEDNELDQETERALKTIVKDLVNKKISSREASSRVMRLCSVNLNTPLDDVLYAVRNLLERIPQKKYNQVIQESNLSCTYVDAVIRPLIEHPDDDIFLIWSNIKIQDDCLERPDLSGMVLINSHFKNIVSVGEVKGEDKAHDSHATLCDLIKVGCFSKEAIDVYNNYGVLGIHVVGFQITFYITTLLAEGLYVMLEVCSIKLPSSIYDMKSFIANLEDLLPIKSIHKQCLKKHNNVSQLQKKGISYKNILHHIKVGRSRKRHCPLVLNH